MRSKRVLCIRIRSPQDTEEKQDLIRSSFTNVRISKPQKVSKELADLNNSSSNLYDSSRIEIKDRRLPSIGRRDYIGMFEGS